MVSAAYRRQFGEVLDRLRTEAVERDRERVDPAPVVQRLLEIGFGRLPLAGPTGGGEATSAELLEAVASLAASDPSVAHVFRVHFSLLEAAGYAGEPTADQVRSISLAAEGLLLSGATSEPATLGFGTRLRRREDGRWALTGTKYYTTGALYADHLVVLAVGEDDRFVSVAIDAGRDGVRLVDDWDGFGQRLSGSGTVVFEDVVVEHDEVLASEANPHDEALFVFYQLYLLALLVGIARNAREEAVDFVAGRTHNYALGNTELPADDPQVLQQLGTLDARLVAIEGAFRYAVDAYGHAKQLAQHGSSDEAIAAGQESVRIAFGAQSTIIAQLGALTTELFEVGGSSAVAAARGLDRHWRNARTISSHNPIVFRSRQVGALLVRGEPITFTSGPSYRLATYGTVPTG